MERELIAIKFPDDPTRAEPPGDYELVLAEDAEANRSFIGDAPRMVALKAGTPVHKVVHSERGEGGILYVWAEHTTDGPGDWPNRNGEYAWRAHIVARMPEVRARPHGDHERPARAGQERHDMNDHRPYILAAGALRRLQRSAERLRGAAGAMHRPNAAEALVGEALEAAAALDAVASACAELPLRLEWVLPPAPPREAAKEGAGTYNGWANHSTWSVALVVESDDRLQRAAIDAMKAKLKEGAGHAEQVEAAREFVHSKVGDAGWFDIGGERSPVDYLPVQFIAGALREVDWAQVARSWAALARAESGEPEGEGEVER